MATFSLNSKLRHRDVLLWLGVCAAVSWDHASSIQHEDSGPSPLRKEPRANQGSLNVPFKQHPKVGDIQWYTWSIHNITIRISSGVQMFKNHLRQDIYQPLNFSAMNFSNTAVNTAACPRRLGHDLFQWPGWKPSWWLIVEPQVTTLRLTIGFLSIKCCKC